MSTATEIEAALFKPAEDGYVFQPANPWIFGRKDRYLVDDAQKRELLAIVVPRRPVLRVIVITAAILLWAVVISLLVWVFAGRSDPSALDFAIIAVLIIVPLYGALVVSLYRNKRRMAPILAAARRTDERITGREIRSAMGKAISLRRALSLGALWMFVGAIQVVNLIIRDARHPMFSDVQSYLSLFTLTIAAGLAVYYGVLAIRKLRQTTAA